MGLFSSIFGSKKKSKSSFDNTTQPIIPDWIQTPIQDYTKAITALGDTDPYQWVAPASDLQKSAWDQAGKLGDRSWWGNEGADFIADAGRAKAPSYTAQGYDAATGTAQSLLKDLDKYMSPYRTQVVNSALADFDHDAAQQRAQADLDLAASGAFGGSGAALTKSELGGQLARARTSTESNLLDQMFNRGTALSDSDAGRRQAMEIENMNAANAARQFSAAAANEAARTNATLEDARLNRLLDSGKGLVDAANSVDANQRANLDTLANLGATQRGVTQDQISAPITMLGTETGLLNGLPLNLFAGQHNYGTGQQTTTSTPSPFQAAGSVLSTLAMFSDERLKTNVVRVGTLENGLGVYDFNYFWGGPRYRGVMAQEVQQIKPEAVITHESGFLMVDYGAL